jgi:hypothetical protein
MKLLHLLSAGILAIPFMAGAEPAQVSKNENLRAKPFTDAKIVIALKKDQTVDIQKREGSWYFLKVKTKTGWAPMLSVHRTAPAAAATGGSLSQTATGRSSGGGVVNTTGVRGLNEETLKTAAFSEEAVAGAEKNRVKQAEADTFAAQGALIVQNVPSLAAPAATGGKK